jgi:hypothetical protein
MVYPTRFRPGSRSLRKSISIPEKQASEEGSLIRTAGMSFKYDF